MIIEAKGLVQAIIAEAKGLVQAIIARQMIMIMDTTKKIKRRNERHTHLPIARWISYRMNW